jgi:hypothetical protein
MPLALFASLVLSLLVSLFWSLLLERRKREEVSLCPNPCLARGRGEKSPNG